MNVKICGKIPHSITQKNRLFYSARIPHMYHKLTQGEHLSGKPGYVTEFDRSQGYLREFSKSQGKIPVSEDRLSMTSTLGYIDV